MQVFNRRRPGEIEQMQVEDYQSRSQIDVTSKTFKSLSAIGKEKALGFSRVTVSGEKRRNVPILVSKDQEVCLLLLIKMRPLAKISENNPYLFGIPSRDGKFIFLGACKLLRTFASRCGAIYPEGLRATELRKQIATSCVKMQLSDGDVLDMANFLGHSSDVHKTIYRQRFPEREITKISKILQFGAGFNEDISTRDSMEKNQTSHVPESSIDEDLDSNAGDNDSAEERDSSDHNDFNTNDIPVQQNIKAKVTRPRWTETAKRLVREAFNDHINGEGTAPTTDDLKRLVANNPEHFMNRTIPAIRT